HDAAQGSAGGQSDRESFHGHLPNSCCVLSEQMARYYLDCARRRTASSPHPCKVPVSQQHGADSHSHSGALMFRPCHGRTSPESSPDPSRRKTAAHCARSYKTCAPNQKTKIARG